MLPRDDPLRTWLKGRISYSTDTPLFNHYDQTRRASESIKVESADQQTGQEALTALYLQLKDYMSHPMIYMLAFQALKLRDI